MAQARSRKIQRIGFRVEPHEELCLQFRAWTPISKPLNSSKGKNTTMLHGDYSEAIYEVSKGKEAKLRVETKLLTGIKGAFRHAMEDVCIRDELDVCSTVNRSHTKEGKELLDEGLHLLGSCVYGTEFETQKRIIFETKNGNRRQKTKKSVKPTKKKTKVTEEAVPELDSELDSEPVKVGQPCLLYDIFGDLLQESKLSVYADPIAACNHKTFKGFTDPVQRVYFATHNRVKMTNSRKSVQNFNESYFSGWFQLNVYVTDLTLVQLGLVIEAARLFKRYGRGWTAGFGHLKQRKIRLVKLVAQEPDDAPGDEGWVEIDDARKEILQLELMQEALKAYYAYVAAHSTKPENRGKPSN
ncbi:MAG: hypothetical protein ACE5OZ_19130 [Candidatus Heimdallarchaeota archaeon]